MWKRRTTTLTYIASVIIGLAVLLVGLAARTLWITYIGMAIQLLGPSLIWLSYERAVRRCRTYEREKTTLDREFRRYILVLFFLAMLFVSLEMIVLIPGWPIMSCAWLATALMGGLIAGKSLKYRR